MIDSSLIFLPPTSAAIISPILLEIGTFNFILIKIKNNTKILVHVSGKFRCNGTAYICLGWHKICKKWLKFIVFNMAASRFYYIARTYILICYMINHCYLYSKYSFNDTHHILTQIAHQLSLKLCIWIMMSTDKTLKKCTLKLKARCH